MLPENTLHLLVELREKNIFNGGRSTLAKVPHFMGFKYKTRKDGKTSMSNPVWFNDNTFIFAEWDVTERKKGSLIKLGSTLMQRPKSYVTGLEDGKVPVATANASSSYMLDLIKDQKPSQKITMMKWIPSISWNGSNTPYSLSYHHNR